MTATSRILHVDDDADIRFLVELTLEPAADLELSSFGSGSDALAAALADPPDLALVDVMMPGMDGVSLAEAFKASETLRRVPVVFVTAKAYPDEVDRLRASGACEVLVKPFDLTVLETTIRELLAREDV